MAGICKGRAWRLHPHPTEVPRPVPKRWLHRRLSELHADVAGCTGAGAWGAAAAAADQRAAACARALVGRTAAAALIMWDSVLESFPPACSRQAICFRHSVS